MAGDRRGPRCLPLVFTGAGIDAHIERFCQNAAMPTDDNPYVSRGGLKLAAALSAFGLEPAGATCADLGCSTGGFVDCWLQHGAARVYAIDTAYGTLDWKMRNDERVVVIERTNALHTPPPEAAAASCGFVSVDLGWTKQDRAIPAALEWLGPGGRIVTLIKPHYEAGIARLDDEQAAEITRRVLNDMPTLGVEIIADCPAPIRGGKAKNLEHLALLRAIRD